LTGHQDSVTALAFSGSGLELISGSLDRRLKIWDVEKKCELATLIGHGDAISSLLLSPDDQFLFSASIDGKIFSWQRPG
jgi:WD40 repeat protein